jgi:DNA-binding MarR family transcriptional regulator
MPESFLLRRIPRYECLEKRSLRYPDLDAGAVEATLVLMRVASDVLEAYGSHLSQHGISQGRFLMMMTLDRNKRRELLPSELAEKIGVTRATVTGLLDGLEKDGFVQRRPHPEDRRAMMVSLTDAGREFIERVLPDHYRRIAALMGDLDGDERRELVRLLTKVAANTDAMREPAAELVGRE